MKKQSLVSVAALICTLVLAACQAVPEPQNPASPQNTAAPVSNEPYALPISDGSVTISIGTTENPWQGFSYTSGLPVWKYLEEQTGVTIDWQVTPAGEYDTVMQTRLAAGSGLPDFIRMPSNPMKYVTDGVILPLNDAIAANGYYTRALYDANPYIRPFVTAPDGNIYFFTSDVSGAASSDPYVYYIREDWLNKFSLPDPETLEDWRNVWTVFLENDANGNGLRDEIPFTNDNTLIGTTIFGNTFNLRLHRSSGWSVNASGTVEYDYIKPEMKELLTWLHDCYQQGLIDKEFSTQNFDSLMKKISTDVSGSCFRALNGLATFNKALSDAGVNGSYKIVTPPVKNADSEIPRYVERYGPVSGLFGFTKDCTENFEEKFKFIDYIVASQPGTYATNFGIEGETYEVVDGRPKFTDFAIKNPEGLPLNAVLGQYGSSPQVPWNRSLNGYWSYQPMESLVGTPEALEAALLYAAQFNIDNFPQGVLLTEDEQGIIGQYQSDIDTYRDEMVVKFIIGTESLDNFEQYVNNIESFGLAEVLKIRQNQWERYKVAK
ncbi:MAG: extracellular solute-binding protein [Clostridiales bacterium]|nr:extracellular solute-binding protein [Clostridiales bacterium]